MESCYPLIVNDKPTRDAAEAIRRLAPPDPAAPGPASVPARAAIASVKDLKSTPFRAFMAYLNTIAEENQLQAYVDNWSKVWEYPWLWFNGLCTIEWSGKRLLDVGSGRSPMPCLIAILGAEVMMVEKLRSSIPLWEEIKDQHQLAIDWTIVPGDDLPFADNSFDVVTSFSVIEHQEDKPQAVAEITRVLKPNGLLAISFDLCEEEWGMAYPARQGKALTVREFEEFLWNSPVLDNEGERLNWSAEQCAEFLEWYWSGKPDSKYVTAAASIRKRL
ncbi:MAG TPA: class I SAM-dependent methyltransferase [Blastocatellia bacterium]|nr:class I SAM-dependent methyltransferase [Blastocatellia bacterium]